MINFGLRKRIHVTQTLSDFHKVVRSENHKYESNNYLKLHGEPMRRKPFKREARRYIIDEGYMFF